MRLIKFLAHHYSRYQCRLWLWGMMRGLSDFIAVALFNVPFLIILFLGGLFIPYLSLYFLGLGLIAISLILTRSSSSLKDYDYIVRKMVHISISIVLLWGLGIIFENVTRAMSIDHYGDILRIVLLLPPACMSQLAYSLSPVIILAIYILYDTKMAAYSIKEACLRYIQVLLRSYFIFVVSWIVGWAVMQFLNKFCFVAPYVMQSIAMASTIVWIIWLATIIIGTEVSQNRYQ